MEHPWVEWVVSEWPWAEEGTQEQPWRTPWGLGVTHSTHPVPVSHQHWLHLGKAFCLKSHFQTSSPQTEINAMIIEYHHLQPRCK